MGDEAENFAELLIALDSTQLVFYWYCMNNLVTLAT